MFTLFSKIQWAAVAAAKNFDDKVSLCNKLEYIFNQACTYFIKNS